MNNAAESACMMKCGDDDIGNGDVTTNTDIEANGNSIVKKGHGDIANLNIEANGYKDGVYKN